MKNSAPCVVCYTSEHPGQWWNLTDYHGWSGRFCADCYDKVSHDSYGNPQNPEEYTAMLLKRNG